jgi:hypothetical protein
MLNAVVLNGILWNAVMLSVVAPTGVLLFFSVFENSMLRHDACSGHWHNYFQYHLRYLSHLTLQVGSSNWVHKLRSTPPLWYQN